MSYLKLKQIKKKYFGYRDISEILGISLESARVTASRFVKSGFLVRAKRNIYALSDNWERFSREERFIFSNLIQTPSYISLMTAMDYYGVTTLMQRNFIESVAIHRTKQVEIGNTVFNYTKIDKKLYFGFLKEKDFFIAYPEKAFMDSIYLKSLRRYDFDLSSIDFKKLNLSKLKKMAGIYPKNTQNLLKDYGHF